MYRGYYSLNRGELPRQKLSERIAEDIDRVLKMIRNLEPGKDYVKVIWLDACNLKGVPIGTNPSDLSVATRVVSPGKYLGIFYDDEFNMPHLLLSTEVQGDEQTVLSIPLPIVRSVIKLSAVEARRSHVEIMRIGGRPKLVR